MSLILILKEQFRYNRELRINIAFNQLRQKIIKFADNDEIDIFGQA